MTFTAAALRGMKPSSRGGAVPGRRSTTTEWAAPSCTAKAMYASRTAMRCISPQWGHSTLKVFLQAAARLLGSVCTRVGNRWRVRGHVKSKWRHETLCACPANKILGRFLKFHGRRTVVGFICVAALPNPFQVVMATWQQAVEGDGQVSAVKKAGRSQAGERALHRTRKKRRRYAAARASEHDPEKFQTFRDHSLV